MNYYVYRIDNLITGEFYIGKRSTKSPILYDNYMGSGVRLKENIKQYGIFNFNKTLLALCYCPKELSIVESAYINYHIQNKLCLNIIMGVDSGFDKKDSAL